MSKIYDSWEASYKAPFGAIRRDEPCRFSLKIPKNISLDSPPVMVVFRTGFKERFLMMANTREDQDSTVYTCYYSENYPGICYYYFALNISGSRCYIKKKGGSEGIIGEGDLFQLTVYDDNFQTPEFIKGGIIYQIFPDRFCKSGIKHENVPSDRIMREDWNGTPLYRPDEHGHVANNDYFGGDLEGIRQKLPYLHELGVTCIYLNPIFEAHENHRYNTANYRKIDPLLGTNEDFTALCKDAEFYDISVIIDGVFSHTGADSVYFNKFGRYETAGAFNSKESEFFPWYTFHEYPNRYEAWWGIDTLPNVNENNEEYTNYICGDDGVLEYWLEMGASGWRLDVADELPDEFLDNLRDTVKNFNPEKLIIGEVWEDASNKESYGVKRRYLLGGQLDSVMNYPFRDAILSYVTGGSVFDFRNNIMRILENYPKPSIDTLMNFISTHDVERAINVLGGESCNGKSKDWQAERMLNSHEYERGKKLLKLAMVLQFFLPGVPSVYYGDEAGQQGYKDPFNRRTYPWGNEDKELVEFVRELGEIRHSSAVFNDGSMHFLIVNDDVLCFARARVHRKKAVVVFINRSDRLQVVEQNDKMISLYRRFEVIRGKAEDGKVIMPPFSYAAFKVEM